MGIFSFFRRKKEDDDFETILTNLETSIREREERLSLIRQREKRGVVWFTTYSLLAWLIYVAAWYFDVLTWFREIIYGQQVGENEIWEEVLGTLPVGAVPVVIFFTRRIVKWWYRRKQERENKELTSLRKRQREQIDKLKKLSNYDKITAMLERHGERTPSTPGKSLKQQQQQQSRPGSVQSTPVKQQVTGGPMTPAQQAIMAAQQHQQANQLKRGVFPAPPPNARSFPPGSPAMMSNTGLMPQSNQPKGLIDKLADALLGDNEQSPASKYALICQRCFAHNGLVLKEEVMDIQFVCPKCGMFNPSRRARMTGKAAVVPAGHDRQREGSSGSVGSSIASLQPTTTDRDEPAEEAEGADEAQNEEKETAPMKPDSRKENLRRRQSGKGGGGAKLQEGSGTSMDVDA